MSCLLLLQMPLPAAQLLVLEAQLKAKLQCGHCGAAARLCKQICRGCHWPFLRDLLSAEVLALGHYDDHRSVRYCDAVCQGRDWAEHRDLCVRVDIESGRDSVIRHAAIVSTMMATGMGPEGCP